MTSDSLFIPPGGDPEDDVLAGCDDNVPCDEDQSPSLLASNEEEGLWIEALAYDTKFLKVSDDLKKICDNLVQAVPEEHHEHHLFKHLVSEAKKAATRPTPRKLVINIVGRSGEGKSSLLNSVLCLPGIAKASSLGEGCTHVPTSYESPFDGQTTNFAVRIECLSMNKIRKQLKRIWHDYYEWQFGDDKEEQKWSEDEMKKAKQDRQGAFDVLRCLFAGEKQFKTIEKAEAFLCTLKDKSTEKVIDTLSSWCAKLLPPPTATDEDPEKIETDDLIPVLEFAADDAEKVHSELQVYAFTDTTYETASLWPLVDRVRVGIRDSPISDLATLVDWPGTGDTNQFRAQASTEGITDCDEIWLVATTVRILSEPIVWQTLHHYAGKLPCAIICTQIDLKCDDYNDAKCIARGVAADELKKLQGEQQSLPKEIKGSETEIVTRSDIKIKGYNPKQAKRQQLSAGQLKTNDDKLTELREKLELKKQALAGLPLRRRQLITGIRVKHFRSRLQDKIKEQCPEASATELFFVSSEHYMGNKGEATIEGGILPLPDTGIPSLRAHILRKASPDKIGTMHRYMNGVDRVLSGLGLRIKPEQLEKCQAALQNIIEKSDTGTAAMQDYIDNINKLTEEFFVHPMKKDVDELVAAAVAAVTGYRAWHAMTLKAFIKRDGDWETFTQEAQRWNERFASSLPEIINKHWDGFGQQEDTAVSQLQALVLKQLENILHEVDSREADHRAQEQDGCFFADHIRTQKDTLKIACAGTKALYDQRMLRINLRATRVGNNALRGFFDNEMQPVYEQARDTRGRKYIERVNDLFENRLEHTESRPSPFMTTADRVKRNVDRQATDQAMAINNDFQARLKDISGWLDTNSPENMHPTSVVEAQGELVSRHQLAIQDFAACKTELSSLEQKYMLQDEKKIKIEKEIAGKKVKKEKKK